MFTFVNRKEGKGMMCLMTSSSPRKNHLSEREVEIGEGLRRIGD